MLGLSSYHPRRGRVGPFEGRKSSWQHPRVPCKCFGARQNRQVRHHEASTPTTSGTGRWVTFGEQTRVNSRERRSIGRKASGPSRQTAHTDEFSLNRPHQPFDGRCLSCPSSLGLVRAPSNLRVTSLGLFLRKFGHFLRKSGQFFRQPT